MGIEIFDTWRMSSEPVQVTGPKHRRRKVRIDSEDKAWYWLIAVVMAAAIVIGTAVVLGFTWAVVQALRSFG